MSRMKFDRVKLSQEHDIPEDTIAGNMELEVEEVEKAFGLRPTMSISTMTRPLLNLPQANRADAGALLARRDAVVVF
jgi:hypothetical protein